MNSIENYVIIVLILFSGGFIVKKFSYFIALLLISFLLFSCTERLSTNSVDNEDTQSTSTKILDWEDWDVSVGHYLHTANTFTFEDTTTLDFTFSLKHWPDPGYGIELYVMTENDYENLKYLKNYNAPVHEIFKTEGTYKFSKKVPAGTYLFVIDNANGGDEKLTADATYAIIDILVTK